MVLELVMASKRHLKPSIREVKMMKKQWFFKVFKVLHDFDMKLLQPGYEYGFKLAFYDDDLNSWQEQNKLFKFRVDKNEH